MTNSKYEVLVHKIGVQSCIPLLAFRLFIRFVSHRFTIGQELEGKIIISMKRFPLYERKVLVALQYFKFSNLISISIMVYSLTPTVPK